MKRSIENRPVFIVDTREKEPLWKEGQHKEHSVIRRKLDTGDYSVEGLEDYIVVERKAGPSELYNNFVAGRKRFYNTISRLKEIPYKFIVIECSFQDVLNPLSYRYVKNSVKASMIVFSSLLSLMLKDNIHVVFAGDNSRRLVTKILLRATEMALKEGRLEQKDTE